MIRIRIRASTRVKVVAVTLGCAAAGAVAGIAGAAASPSTHSNSAKATKPALPYRRFGLRPGGFLGRGGFGPGGLGFGPGGPAYGPGGLAGGLGFGPGGPAGGLGLGPAVHETAVVLDKAGTGYITVTEDSGTVQSVSGSQLTIKEGLGKVTYRTITLTIPSAATVYRDASKSSLSALRSGDRVRVIQSSEGTSVVAIDSSFIPWRRVTKPPAAATPTPPAGAPMPAYPPSSAGA